MRINICKRNQGQCQTVIFNSCCLIFTKLVWSSCFGSPRRRLSCKLVNDWDTKVLFHSPQFTLYLGSISYNHPLPSSTFCCAYCHLAWRFFSPAFLFSLLLNIFPSPPCPVPFGFFPLIHYFWSTWTLQPTCPNQNWKYRRRRCCVIHPWVWAAAVNRTHTILRNTEQLSHLYTEALKEKGSPCFVHNALCFGTIIPFTNKDQNSIAFTC